MAFVGAVDLGRDRQLVPPGGGAIQLDRPPILQPGVGVDPEIHLVAREMTRQKRPRHLRLQGLRARGRGRETRYPSPARTTSPARLRARRAAPAPARDREPRSATIRRQAAHRAHRVAEQREIAAIGAADDNRGGESAMPSPGRSHPKVRAPAGSRRARSPGFRHGPGRARSSGAGGRHGFPAYGSSPRHCSPRPRPAACRARSPGRRRGRGI